MLIKLEHAFDKSISYFNIEKLIKVSSPYSQPLNDVNGNPITIYVIVLTFHDNHLIPLEVNKNKKLLRQLGVDIGGED